MREIEVLYGREAERIQLQRILDAARSGRGTAAVLYGDPAIGKTALLRDTIARAEDFRVLRCQGVRDESELNYAALHELLLPVADRLNLLPEAQARTLGSVLGLDSGSAAVFPVGAALVRLLAVLAAERPLLLVVDDARLIDAETARVLTFAARRLSDAPVALLCALRDDPVGSVWRELPALPVTGLPDAAARSLVADRHGTVVPLRLSRVLALAGGNPLALIELPHTIDDLAGTIPEPAPLSPLLRRAFEDRVTALPDQVRTLLTVAAGETGGVLGTVTRAAAALGVGPAAWEHATETGLLTVADGRVERRHALLCAAVHAAAGAAQRRAAHLALAAALPESGDADLRIWHRAMASERPDEPLAAELAERARAGGRGAVAAATMVRQAAAITPDPMRAGQRRATAARFAWAGGDVASARGLLDRATLRLGTEAAAVASGGLAGLLEFVAGEPERAARLLQRDAALLDAEPVPAHPAEAGPHAPRTAVDLRVEAARARWAAGHDLVDLGSAVWTSRTTGSVGVATAAAGSGAIASRTAGPGVVASRTAGPEVVAARTAGPVGVASRVAGPAVFAPHPGGAGIRPLPPAPLILLWGMADRALEPYTQAVAALRGVSAPAAVCLLPQLAIVQFATARWNDAEASLAEAFEIAGNGGVENVLAHCWSLRTKIAALKGDSDAVLDSAERVLTLARPRRSHALIASVHWHLGFHALSLGDPETAYLRLRTIAMPGHDARHPTYARLAAQELVEAACRVGRRDEAAEYYAVIQDWALRSRADWAIAAAYTCRALLATDERADRDFRRALAVRPSRHDLNHARTQLLYGKWLRRARRRGDAAEQLRSAAEAFERMGATHWVTRTRQELELTGRRAAPVTGHTASVLTPQESRVARLAAQGMTNREIGTELFLSPRTVGHHLSRVFGKLGLSGRADLADVDFDNGMRITRPR